MSLRKSLGQQFLNLTEAEQEKLLNRDPVRWIENNFYIPETKDDPKLRGRLVLAPYQRDTIRELFSPDPTTGLMKYSIMIWSDIKKSIKSTIAAAVGMYIASHTDWGEGYVIANDLKQADSRVAKYMRRSIDISKKHKGIIGKEFKSTGYKIINTRTHAELEAIPIDPSGEAGSNADWMVYSELWGANEDAKSKMWSEMTLSPTKHGKSFRHVESYAGFTEESLLLYRLYEKGVINGEQLWPDRLYDVTDGTPTPLELFVNPEARMLCLWNTQPRLPWQSKEYYASEQAVLLPNEFLRMHRNQWVTSEETFVPIEWWDACRRSPAEMPQFPDKKRLSIVIALDAAVSDDSFAITGWAQHPTIPGDVVKIFNRHWKPPKGKRKIDYQGTEENPGPELFLRKKIDEYHVIQVTYDPYQLHDMAGRIKKDSIVWMKEFGQMNQRLKADSQFRDMIRERHVWHDGDEDLRSHIQNANAKIDPEERRVRIVKRQQHMKVDLAVSSSMAIYEVMRLNL